MVELNPPRWNPDDGEEKACFETLRSAEDLRLALSQVRWTPSAPVDLRLWKPVLERMGMEMRQLLNRNPDLVASCKRNHANVLENSETLLIAILNFLSMLISWGIHRKAFSHCEEVELLLRARNERVMLAALDVLASLTASTANSCAHRSISTRFSSRPARELGTYSLSNRPQSVMDDLANLASVNDQLSSAVMNDTEGESDEVEMVDRRPTPVPAEKESADLHQATNNFDLHAESLEDFCYEKDGFAALSKERRRMSKSFMVRIRILAASMLPITLVTVHASKTQLMRDACSVLFSSGVKRDQDIVAARRVLEHLSFASARSVALSLASRVPGRGVLVASIRRYLAEADADPETKLGLSFARVAERKSTKQFWLMLESQLVLCEAIKSSESGLSALVDGGVVRAIFSWVRRSLIETDEEEDAAEDLSNRYFALSAGLFFYMSLPSQSSLAQLQKDGADLVQGCTKLVSRISARQVVPSFAEKTLLCNIIWAISYVGQVYRRAAGNNNSSEARRSLFSLTAESSALRDLLLVMLDHTAQLGGGVLRCTAELICELTRGDPISQIIDSPLGAAILRVLEEFDTRCPCEDTEGIVAVRPLMTFLRRSPSGRNRLAEIAPFAKMLACFRDRRFFPALSHGWNDVGLTIKEFLHENQDLAYQCSRDLRKSFDLCKEVVPTHDAVIARHETLRFASEMFSVRDVAKDFLSSQGGMNLILSACEGGTRKETMELAYVSIRNLIPSCRKETVEGLCQFLLERLRVVEKPEDIFFIDWLCILLVPLLNSPPGRHPLRTESVVGADVCMDTFQALAQWDANCVESPRSYATLLMQLAHLARPAQGASTSSRPQSRSASEQRLITHLAWTIESVMDSNPDLSLARACEVLLQNNSADEVLRGMFLTQSSYRLMDIACAALKRTDMATTGFRILWIFADSQVMKTADWPDETAFLQASHAFALGLAERLLKLDLQKLNDRILSGFVLLVARIAHPARSWRPPPKVAPLQERPKSPPKPEFVADNKVVHPLMDMGFHVAHIQAAQERLRSNAVEELAAYLLENPRPVSEEDEVKFAVWLSCQMGETAAATEENQAAKVEEPPEPELSQEELAEKTRMDEEEARNKHLMLELRQRALSCCATLGLKRFTIAIPFELIAATQPPPVPVTRPSLRDNVMSTTVYFSNESSETFKVCCSPNGGILIRPHDHQVPVHTYAGNLLTIKRRLLPLSEGESESHFVEGSVLGCIEARGAFTTVTIPESFDRKFEKIEVLEISADSRETMDKASKARQEPFDPNQRRTVLFVNETGQRVSLHPLDAFYLWERPGETVLQESFRLEPGQTRAVECRANAAWELLNLPYQEPIGTIWIPPKSNPDGSDEVKLIARIHFNQKLSETFANVASSIIETICDEKAIPIPRVIDALRPNIPLLSTVLMQAPDSWLEHVPTDLFAGVLNHALPSPMDPPAKLDTKGFPSTSGKKRAAGEAELMEEVQEEFSSSFEGKKKKSAAYSTSKQDGSVASGFDCESPNRALGLLLLNRLCARPALVPENHVDIYQRLACALPSLNGFETDAALTLLTHHVHVLRLQDVIDCVRKHGYLTSAAQCIQLLLAVPSDVVSKHRRTALMIFNRLLRRLPKDQKEKRVSLDAFVKELDIPKEESESFSQAVYGCLKMDAVDPNSIVACEIPGPDLEIGQTDLVALVDLLVELDSQSIAALLDELVAYGPRRVVIGLSMRSVLIKRLMHAMSFADTSVPRTHITNLYVLTILRKLATTSRDAERIVAHELVSVLNDACSSTSDTSDLCFTFTLLLLRSLRSLVIPAEEERLTEIILNKLTRLALAFKENAEFTAVVALFQFLVSREVRETITKGGMDAGDSALVDDDEDRAGRNAVLEEEWKQFLRDEAVKSTRPSLLTSLGHAGMLVEEDDATSMMPAAHAPDTLMTSHSLQRRGAITSDIFVPVSAFFGGSNLATPFSFPVVGGGTQTLIRAGHHEEFFRHIEQMTEEISPLRGVLGEPTFPGVRGVTNPGQLGAFATIRVRHAGSSGPFRPSDPRATIAATARGAGSVNASSQADPQSLATLLRQGLAQMTAAQPAVHPETTVAMTSTPMEEQQTSDSNAVEEEKTTQ